MAFFSVSPSLSLSGELAERGAGAVEQRLPSGCARPALERAAVDAGALVVVEAVRDDAVVEPGARLLHGVAVLDAVDGDGLGHLHLIASIDSGRLGALENPIAKSDDLRPFAADLRVDQIVSEVLELYDVGELDEPSVRDLKRHHGSRQQADALPCKNGLQQQAGIVERRPARRSDFVDPLCLKPKMPTLTVGIMHVRPARQLGGSRGYAELCDQRRGSDRNDPYRNKRSLRRPG